MWTIGDERPRPSGTGAGYKCDGKFKIKCKPKGAAFASSMLRRKRRLLQICGDGDHAAHRGADARDCEGVVKSVG